MSQNLSSAAIVIGVLRENNHLEWLKSKRAKFNSESVREKTKPVLSDINNVFHLCS